MSGWFALSGQPIFKLRDYVLKYVIYMQYLKHSIINMTFSLGYVIILYQLWYSLECM
jgi:hypothetical protein